MIYTERTVVIHPAVADCVVTRLDGSMVVRGPVLVRYSWPRVCGFDDAVASHVLINVLPQEEA